jgi:4-aminobutyrate aminotransferase-like enzyme
MMETFGSTVAWANPPAESVPALVTGTPGPRSCELHEEMDRLTGGSVTRGVKLHPVAYREGCGVTLTDVDGNRYLDFSSGIVVTNLGHAHPRVTEAIAAAARRLDNVHEFATPEKVAALRALDAVTPDELTRFVFFSTGSEAIEAAMRVARAATGRTGFVSFHHDYHGRTGGAASVTAHRASNGMRDPGSYLAPNGHAYRCRICAGACDLRCAEMLGDSIEQNVAGQLAGVVMEIMTNSNGATTYAPGYVARVADIVHEAGGLLIADEVATGFGRTGRWFASDHEGVVPDVLVLGKGMGNGFPVTAIAVKEEYADAVAASFPSTTYGGNPMACAAVAEVVAVMTEESIVEHCAAVGELTSKRLAGMAAVHPLIGDVRGRGALHALEIVRDHTSKEPFADAGNFVFRAAFRRGLAWATAGHILRITPPIVISEELMVKGLDIIEEAVAEAEAFYGYA